MSESHVVSGLKDKRARISGQIRALDKQAKALRIQLAHIDASLEIFDPRIEPQTISPLRPVRRIRYLEPGEMTRLIVGTLRRHPGASATEIATGILVDRGVPTDAEIVGDLKDRLLLALRKMKREGKVTRDGNVGMEPRWGLAAEAEPD